jgi:hypothetical protein
MTKKQKGRNGDRATPKQSDAKNHTPKAPQVTGQCAEVLALIREHQPVLSFVLTADHAIPEAAARVHELRAKGFNVATRILPEVEFRGRIRRNAALYVMGIPEWPRPGFLADEEGGGDE